MMTCVAHVYSVRLYTGAAVQCYERHHSVFAVLLLCLLAAHKTTVKVHTALDAALVSQQKAIWANN